MRGLFLQACFIELICSFRTSAKSFSSARRDCKKKYPSQEDILEWAKPALPLEEEFDDLFLEDLVWAHAVSLHQRLNTPQFHSLLLW